ncbi:MAG: SIS domain-containing protein [Burkholderiaceae bacterium]|nr:SIS domain-containing protein [Burkholderiaceae bacterium]
MRTFPDALHRIQSLILALDKPDIIVRVESAARLLTDVFFAGKPLLVCGNGGSAADAQHIAGELVGRFRKERKALPVIALGTDPAVLTALGNDYGYEQVFARQVEAYGVAGGVLWAISTSGNSPNILAAAEKARHLEMKVLALTGLGGGKLAQYADLLLDVPSVDTPLIQQAHQVIYHHLCECVENWIINDA